MRYRKQQSGLIFGRMIFLNFLKSMMKRSATTMNATGPMTGTSKSTCNKIFNDLCPYV